MERRFAVLKVKGDSLIPIKTFPLECREDAIAYGAHLAEYNIDGLITCEQVMVDDSDRIIGNTFRVYEVWNSADKRK